MSFSEVIAFMPILETSRLLLRPFCADDLNDFSIYAADAELRRQFGWPKEADDDRIFKIFDSLIGRDSVFALVSKDNGCMIGHISIVPSELAAAEDEDVYGKNGVTIAFAAAPEYQRRGYMTEALAVVLRYLFNETGTEFVHCSCFSFNDASQSLQRKLGFVYYSHHTVTRYGEKVTIVNNILGKDSYIAGSKNES